MNLNNLFTDDDAVSPVIGVILMVAITVILAAVIGAFVLNLGGGQESPPQTDWQWSDGNYEVTLSHNGGEEVSEPSQITLTGSGADGEATLDNSDLFGSGSISASSDEVTLTNTTTSDDAVDLAGNSGTLELVWESSDGSQSQIIDEHNYDVS